jgi:hypothetical protein
MNGGPELHCDKRAMHVQHHLINGLRFILKVVSRFVAEICREIATDIFGFPGKGS